MARPAQPQLRGLGRQAGLRLPRRSTALRAQPAAAPTALPPAHPPTHPPVRRQQVWRAGEVRQEGRGQGADEALPHAQRVQVRRPPADASQEHKLVGAAVGGAAQPVRAARGARLLPRHEPACEVSGAMGLQAQAMVAQAALQEGAQESAGAGRVSAAHVGAASLASWAAANQAKPGHSACSMRQRQHPTSSSSGGR